VAIVFEEMLIFLGIYSRERSFDGSGRIVVWHCVSSPEVALRKLCLSAQLPRFALLKIAGSAL